MLRIPDNIVYDNQLVHAFWEIIFFYHLIESERARETQCKIPVSSFMTLQRGAGRPSD